MANEKYFEKPQQIWFHTYDEGLRLGIAYHDEIICGCCGEVIKIDKVTGIIAERGSWQKLTIK